MDPVFKALADPTRRSLLDELFGRDGQSLSELEDRFAMTRFGVMKHLDALRESALVHTREEGRQRVNSLNVFPIRQIYERWVSPFQEVWSSQLLGIKELAEQGSPAAKQSVSRKKNKS